VELRQVRAFVEVARTGSFARAADVLHVGKSALSKQIRLLETELGAPLFVRGGGRREAQLTDAGEAFLPEAVTIVKAVDQGFEHVRRVSGSGGGHVNFVIAQGWETWPEWQMMIAGFRQAHPDITLHLRSERSLAPMMEAVGSGAADVAVMWFISGVPPSQPGVIVEELHGEPVGFMVPPGHRLDGVETVSMDELRDERFLLMPMELDLVNTLAAPFGFIPRCDVSVDNPSLLRPLLLSGDGIAPLTRSEAPYHAPAWFVELAPPVNCSVGIAMRRAHRSPATRAVRDFFRDAVADSDAAKSVQASEAPAAQL
jgi:LysR family transcriptional activator of glutamate synthase operon